MTKSTLPKNDEENTTEKRRRKNNRDDPIQDDGKPRRQKRRTKVDAIESKEQVYDDQMKEAEVKVRSNLSQLIFNLVVHFVQDTTEKQEENVKKRRGKRINSTDKGAPKERTKRQPKKKSRKIMESSKVLTNDEFEPTLTTDTTDDNTMEQPISDTEHPDQSNGRLNYNSVYLIVFLVLTAIILAYFFQFK